MKYFTQKNYRVIAPNFPPYSITTTTGKFNHSARERTQYVKDFLNAINIKNIDIVIVHSAGFLSAVLLSEDAQFKIDKIVLINPGATYHLLQNTWVKLFAFNYRIFNAMYKRQFLRVLMEPCVKTFIGTASKVSSFVASDHSHVLLQGNQTSLRLIWLQFSLVAGAITSYTDVNEIVTGIDNLRQKLENNNIKLLLIFSEKDELIPKANFYALASKLGAHARDENTSFEYYDIDENLEKCRKGTAQPWVTVFRAGSHIFFMKNTSVVNDVISKFIMSAN